MRCLFVVLLIACGGTSGTDTGSELDAGDVDAGRLYDCRGYEYCADAGTPFSALVCAASSAEADAKFRDAGVQHCTGSHVCSTDGGGC